MLDFSAFGFVFRDAKKFVDTSLSRCAFFLLALISLYPFLIYSFSFSLFAFSSLLSNVLLLMPCYPLAMLNTVELHIAWHITIHCYISVIHLPFSLSQSFVGGDGNVDATTAAAASAAGGSSLAFAFV